MSDYGSDLHSEFPEDAAILAALKQEDPHFRSLCERYHQVNKAVHLIDVNLEPASDARLEDLKKQRLSLLDQIAVLVSGRKVGAC
jgi:uncharacterized protein YdcH (DUF465 family)